MLFPFLHKFQIQIALLMFIGALGFGVYQYSQIVQAERNTVDLMKANDKLNAELNKFAIAASENTKTIEKLLQEKQDLIKANEELAKDKEANKRTINNLASALKIQADDPQNKVALSPAVKYTLTQIEQLRQYRANGNKANHPVGPKE